jgi:phage baseplate assembly protein W
MAFRVSNIEPIDLQPRVAIGISLPFNGPTGFNSTYDTATQLKSNLIAFLLTNKGERVLNPTFGANLRELVFEQIHETTLEEFKEIIKSRVEKQFPRVSITNIINDFNPDTNRINISFTYRVTQTNIEDNISINVT